MADTHDRVFFELLQKLSLVSGCLLVSYTPLARFVVPWSHLLSGVARTIVPIKGGFWSLRSTQAQTVDAETL